MSDTGALILEIAFTAFFLAVILAATKRAPALAALAIPLTLVAIHFGIATLSGSSVNPARSIGSAVVGGDLSHIWIYIVGPIVGGIIGWGIWRLVDGGEDEPASASAARMAFFRRPPSRVGAPRCTFSSQVCSRSSDAPRLHPAGRPYRRLGCI